jgi:TRAP-type C4-dicarboxylate transport system permease small subunit
VLGTLQKGADGLTSLSALVGTIGLLGEVVVILIDVIGRYFGSPLSGAQDIATMLMVLVVFGGMSLCSKIGGHISVDLLENSMPRWLIRAGDVASGILGAVIFIGIAWTTWASIAQMRGYGIILSTNIIGLPFDWFKGAIVVMSSITALGMILRVITLVAGYNPRKEAA